MSIQRCLEQNGINIAATERAVLEYLRDEKAKLEKQAADLDQTSLDFSKLDKVLNFNTEKLEEIDFLLDDVDRIAERQVNNEVEGEFLANQDLQIMSMSGMMDMAVNVYMNDLFPIALTQGIDPNNASDKQLLELANKFLPKAKADLIKLYLTVKGLGLSRVITVDGTNYTVSVNVIIGAPNEYPTMLEVQFSTADGAQPDFNDGRAFRVLNAVMDLISVEFSNVEYEGIVFVPTASVNNLNPKVVSREEVEAGDNRKTLYKKYMTRLYGQEIEEIEVPADSLFRGSTNAVRMLAGQFEMKGLVALRIPKEFVNKNPNTTNQQQRRGLFGKPNNNRSSKGVSNDTLSNEQVDFFQESQVRDENGNLMAMHHGTDADFNIFSDRNAGTEGNNAQGPGFYFTHSLTEAAAVYGRAGAKKVFLNIKRPLKIRPGRAITKLTVTQIRSIANELNVELSEEQIQEISKEPLPQGLAYMTNMLRGQVEPVQIRRVVSNVTGYDGIILQYPDGSLRHAIAWFPEQVKESTNERPTSSPDMRYADSADDAASNYRAFKVLNPQIEGTNFVDEFRVRMILDDAAADPRAADEVGFVALVEEGAGPALQLDGFEEEESQPSQPRALQAKEYDFVVADEDGDALAVVTLSIYSSDENGRNTALSIGVNEIRVTQQYEVTGTDGQQAFKDQDKVASLLVPVAKALNELFPSIDPVFDFVSDISDEDVASVNAMYRAYEMLDSEPGFQGPEMSFSNRRNELQRGRTILGPAELLEDIGDYIKSGDFQMGFQTDPVKAEENYRNFRRNRGRSFVSGYGDVIEDEQTRAALNEAAKYSDKVGFLTLEGYDGYYVVRAWSKLGQQLGEIHYNVNYRNNNRVQITWAKAEQRRKGIGTAMYAAVQLLNPDQAITTNSINDNSTPTRVYLHAMGIMRTEDSVLLQYAGFIPEFGGGVEAIEEAMKQYWYKKYQTHVDAVLADNEGATVDDMYEVWTQVEDIMRSTLDDIARSRTTSELLETTDEAAAELLIQQSKPLLENAGIEFDFTYLANHVAGRGLRNRAYSRPVKRGSVFERITNPVFTLLQRITRSFSEGSTNPVDLIEDAIASEIGINYGEGAVPPAVPVRRTPRNLGQSDPYIGTAQVNQQFQGVPMTRTVYDSAPPYLQGALYDANRMYLEGESLVDIWRETGMYLRRHPINGAIYWTYHINPANMKLRYTEDELRKLAADNGGEVYMRLHEVIDYPELFDLFPSFRNMNVMILGEESTSGSRNDESIEYIILGLRPDPKGIGQLVDRDIKGIIAHEIQHTIQYRMGEEVFSEEDYPDIERIEELLKAKSKSKELKDLLKQYYTSHMEQDAMHIQEMVVDPSIDPYTADERMIETILRRSNNKNVKLTRADFDIWDAIDLREAYDDQQAFDREQFDRGDSETRFSEESEQQMAKNIQYIREMYDQYHNKPFDGIDYPQSIANKINSEIGREIAEVNRTYNASESKMEFVITIDDSMIRGVELAVVQPTESGTLSQGPIVTINVLQDRMLVGKKGGGKVKIHTLQQVLKQKGVKQIEKKIIEEVLEMPIFKGKKEIDYDQLVYEVHNKMMSLEVIVSGSYADYGSSNIGLSVDADTHIYNSHLNHGYSGHFSRDFQTDEETAEFYNNPDNFEIRQAGELFLVVKKGARIVTEADLAVNMLHVARTEEDAQLFIDETIKNKDSNNPGLFGHTRVWRIDDDEGLLIAEVQSDAFQKQKAETLVMTSHMLDEQGELKSFEQLDSEYEGDALKYARGSMAIRYRYRMPAEIANTVDLYFRVNSTAIDITTQGAQQYNYVYSLLIRNTDDTVYREEPEEGEVEAVLKEAQSAYYKLVGHFIETGELADPIPVQVGQFTGYMSYSGNLNFAVKTQDGTGVWTTFPFPIRNTPVMAPPSEVINNPGEALIAVLNGMNGAAIFRTAKDNFSPELYKELFDLQRNEKKYKKAFFDSLSIEDQQFIAHRKNYNMRMIREEMARAAVLGVPHIYFPTGETIAYIEGFSSIEGDKVPYEDSYGQEIATNSSDLEVGEIIKHAGDEYIVIEADSYSIRVVRTEEVNSTNDQQFIDEEVDHRTDDDMYQLEGIFEYDAPLSEDEANDMLQEARDNVITVGYLEDVAEIDTDENGETFYIFREDEIRDIIENAHRDYYEHEDIVQYMEDMGYRTVFRIDDNIYFAHDELDELTFKQPDQYDGGEADFDIDLLDDTQRTIVDSYITLAKEVEEGFDGVEHVEIEGNNGEYTKWLKIPVAPSFNPQITAFSFGGEIGAQRADALFQNPYLMARLSQAKALEEEGFGPSEIWAATGWYKLKNGKWAFEINTSNMVTKAGKLKTGKIDKDLAERHGFDPNREFSYMTLGDMIDFQPLFTAYPQLRDMKVWMVPSGEGYAFTAVKQGQFFFNVDYLVTKDGIFSRNWDGQMESNLEVFMTALATQDPEVHKIILHEVQHMIQAIEGFPQGASADVYYRTLKQLEQVYRRAIENNDLSTQLYIEEQIQATFAVGPEAWKAALSEDLGVEELADVLYGVTAGEIQSRMVEDRRNLTTEERLNYSPTDEEMFRDVNIPRRLQIMITEDDQGEYDISAISRTDIAEMVPQRGPEKAMFEKLVHNLKATGLVKDIVIDKRAMAKELAATNKALGTNVPLRHIKGFVTDEGVVYLNPLRLDMGTALHEVGHLWADWAAENEPALYQQGLDLVRGSIYHTSVMKEAQNPNSVYHTMSEAKLLEESLVRAIEDQGMKMVNITKRNNFREWLNGLFDIIKRVLGVKGASAEQLQRMSLKTFARGIAADLLSGVSYEGGVRSTTNFSESQTDGQYKSLVDDRLKQLHDDGMVFATSKSGSFISIADALQTGQDVMIARWNPESKVATPVAFVKNTGNLLNSYKNLHEALEEAFSPKGRAAADNVMAFEIDQVEEVSSLLANAMLPEFNEGEPDLVYKVGDKTFEDYADALKEGGDIEIGVDSDGTFKRLVKVKSNEDVTTRTGFINTYIKNGILSPEQVIVDGENYLVAAGTDDARRAVNEQILIADLIEHLGASRFEFKDGLFKIHPDPEESPSLEQERQITSDILQGLIRDPEAAPVLNNTQPELEPDQLILRLTRLLRSMGVGVMSIAQYNERYAGRNGKAIDVQGLADIVNRVVAVASGAELDVLTEETMHFLIEALPQDVVGYLLENIQKSREYVLYADQYREIYTRENPDKTNEEIEEMVNREVLGKVFTNATLARLQEQSTPPSFYRRAIRAVKEFFQRLNPFSGYANEYYQVIRLVDMFVIQQDPAAIDTLDDTFGAEYKLYNANTPSTPDNDAFKARLNNLQDKLSNTIKNLRDAKGFPNEDVRKTYAGAGVAGDMQRLATYLGRTERVIAHVKNALNLSREDSKLFSNSERNALINLESKILPEISSLAAHLRKMPDREFAADYYAKPVDEISDRDVQRAKKDKERIIKQMDDIRNDILTIQAQKVEIQEQVYDTLVDRLIDKYQLPQSLRSLYRDRIEQTDKEINVLIRLFGTMNNTSNGYLVLGQKLMEELDSERREVSVREQLAFDNALRELGLGAEDLPQLVEGNYMLSPYDFQRFEDDIDQIKMSAMIEVVGQDVYNPESVAEFRRDRSRGGMPDMTLDQERRYHAIVNKEIFDRELTVRPSVDEFYEKRRNTYEAAGIAENSPTLTLLSELSVARGEIFSRSKDSNGNIVLTPHDKARIKVVSFRRKEAKSLYDRNGDLKRGIRTSRVRPNDPNVIFIEKDGLFYTYNLNDGNNDARIAIELHRIDAQYQTEREMGLDESEVDFDKIRRQIDKIAREEGAEKAVEFILNNVGVSFTEDFWNTLDAQSAMEAAIESNELTQAQQAIVDRIRHVQGAIAALKNLYRDSTNPAEVLGDEMKDSDRFTILDLTEQLSGLYADLRTEFELAGIELEGSPVIREKQINNSYENYLVERGVTPMTESEFNVILDHSSSSGQGRVRDIRNQAKNAQRGGTPAMLDEFDVIISENGLESGDYIGAGVIAARQYLISYFTRTTPEGYISFEEMDRIGGTADQKLDAMLTQLSVYNDSNFYEFNVNYNYRTNSDQYRNPDYDDNFLGGQYQPNLDKYRNDKYYEMFGINPATPMDQHADAVTRNHKLFEALQIVVKYKKEAHERMSVSSLNNVYLIPQVRRTGTDRLQQAFAERSLKPIRDSIQDAINFNKDEPDTGLRDAEQNLKIPQLYITPLDPDFTASDDIYFGMLLMIDESALYKARVNKLADMNALEQKILENKRGGKAQESDEVYRMFKSAMNESVFGIKDKVNKQLDLPIIGTFDLAALVRSLHKIFKFKNLAGITIPLTSLVTARGTAYIESIIGQSIDRATHNRAKREFKGMASETMKETFEYNDQSKLNKLMLFAGQYEFTDRAKDAKFGKGRFFNLPKTVMMLHNLANFPIIPTLVIESFMDTRLIDGRLITREAFSQPLRRQGMKQKEIDARWNQYSDQSMYDYLIINEEGVNIDPRVYDQLDDSIEDKEAYIKGQIEAIRDRSKERIKIIDGQIPESQKIDAKRHFLWDFTTTHKSWLFVTIQRRFKGINLNLENGRLDQGHYITLWETMKAIINEMVQGELNVNRAYRKALHNPKFQMAIDNKRQVLPEEFGDVNIRVRRKNVVEGVPQTGILKLSNMIPASKIAQILSPGFDYDQAKTELVEALDEAGYQILTDEIAQKEDAVFDEKYSDMIYTEDLRQQASTLSSYAMRRVALEGAFLFAVGGLYLALSGAADDDDFKRNAPVASGMLAYLAYINQRMNNELGSTQFGGLIGEGLATVENPVTQLAYLKNTFNAITSGKPFSGKEITRGPFKGKTEARKFWQKITPGAYEIYKLDNVDATRKTYEFYNQTYADKLNQLFNGD